MLTRLNSFTKDLLLASRIGLLLSPLKGFFRFLGNFCDLSIWISQHHKKIPFTDFYKPVRNYADREKLYLHIADLEHLKTKPVQYYEFGVSGGSSFRWWIGHNKNPASSFYGFDTFEGLPEDWNFYKKGAMTANIPQIDDKRGRFLKGLFQNTVPGFLKSTPPQNSVVKILHMDADLYSATLFALTSFAPWLQKGDIIIFDEFNVPNHEFAAWNDFVRSYYIEYEVMGGVNNYYQTAFKYLGVKAEL
jgi:O-methyltransferase